MTTAAMCYQPLGGKWRQVRSSTTFHLEDMEFESLPLSLDTALPSHSLSQLHLNLVIWHHLYKTLTIDAVPNLNRRMSDV